MLDYGFTAEVEKEFDEIAEGLKKWNDMIDRFYGPFHKSVNDALEDEGPSKWRTITRERS